MPAGEFSPSWNQALEQAIHPAKLRGGWYKLVSSKKFDTKQVSTSELPWIVCAVYQERNVLSRWPNKLCHWLCQENKEMNTVMCASL